MVAADPGLHGIEDARMRRLLELAIGHYQGRRLREAERLLRQVLAADPNHADALFFLGSIASDVGRKAEAERLLGQAIARKPLEAAFLVSLANVLQSMGRGEEAARYYHRALKLRPDFAEVHVNLGHLHRSSGRLDEAHAAYRRALAIRPALLAARLGRAGVIRDSGEPDRALEEYRRILADFPAAADARYDLANFLHERGDHDGAIAHYEQVLQLAPDHVPARNNLAALLLARSRVDEALSHLNEAQRLRPDHPETLGNLIAIHEGRGDFAATLPFYGRLLRSERAESRLRFRYALALQFTRHYREAIPHYRSVVAADPGHVDARSNLGLCLKETGQLGEAQRELEAALNLDPEHWQAHHNLALVLRARAEYEQSGIHLQRALALRPDDTDVLTNLGNNLCLRHRHTAGIECFRRVLEREQRHPEALRNISQALLGMGEFEEGWRYDFLKWERMDLRAQGRDFPYPWWQGEPLTGKTVLVWGEQGLGDQIMFMNALPDLLRLGGRCVLECNRRLLPIFSRSFPGPEIIPRDKNSRERIAGMGIDYQVPMSGVPRFFRGSLTAFPRHNGYLRADPDRARYWKARLEERGAGRKIGISWRGGTEKTGGAKRSTDLPHWLPLLRNRSVRFVSLQYTDCREELRTLAEAHGVEIAHWQEAIDDYDETAALVEALDGVISVCTAAIHLAGALGKPTWVLVPYRPGWRYLLQGESMPWYPSVRMFRQSDPSRWDDVIERAAAALAGDAG